MAELERHHEESTGEASARSEVAWTGGLFDNCETSDGADAWILRLNNVLQSMSPSVVRRASLEPWSRK